MFQIIQRLNFVKYQIHRPHHLRYLYTSPVILAGHSKWQNIKHIKASKDQQKSQLFNRLIVKIRSAVQKQGGADPNLNREFADVIQECRKANMPNTTIEKAVKRSLEKKTFLLKLEIIGPENSLLVVDAETDNKNYFRNEVRKILKKKIGFGFADEGRALSLFNEKGIVRVKNEQNDSNFDMEKAEEIAIEAEAEEVRIDDEDDTILMFIGDIYSHQRVKTYIEKNYSKQYKIIENGVELLPYIRQEVSEQSFQQIIDAINEIGELEGVNRVYNNI